MKVEIYNPKDKPLEELPIIYGFNNGGSPGWMIAQLIAADGEPLGSHSCSDECFMPRDLGILKDQRSDRHETFRKYYPEGYKMEFVPLNNVKSHKGLQKAFEAYKIKYPPKETGNE